MYSFVWFSPLYVEAIGPELGTFFAEGQGCPRCSCGAPQISPVRLVASALPKGLVCQSAGGRMHIRDTLATELQLAFPGIGELRQAEKRRSFEKLPWFQILPQHTLPPMEPVPSQLVLSKDWACPVCHRTGYGFSSKNPKLPQAVYRLPPALRRERPYWLNTWECFGPSMYRRRPFTDSPLLPAYAQPALVVRDDVGAWFQERVGKKVRVDPVTILD